MKRQSPRHFWILGTGFNSGAVIHAMPDGAPEDWEFLEGTSLARRFPSRATVRFAKSYPKQIKILDSVANEFGVPLVSANFRAILESLAPRDCEFLPVTILDHKGKIASKAHHLVNVVRLEDAVDMKRSKYDTDAFDDAQIGAVEELHLKPDAIRPDARIFRAATMREYVLIDDVVHARLQADNVTGLRLFPAEGWDGDDM